jgi:hypothetical protein
VSEDPRDADGFWLFGFLAFWFFLAARRISMTTPL